MSFQKYKSVHLKVRFLICSVFLFIFSTQVFARPWCSSAKLNITEQKICNNFELRELDAQLAQVYSTAKAHNKDSEQLDWLKNYRNACYGNINCIAQEYRNRIAVLKGRIDFVYAANSRPWCSASRLNTTEKAIAKYHI